MVYPKGHKLNHALYVKILLLRIYAELKFKLVNIYIPKYKLYNDH